MPDSIIVGTAGRGGARVSEVVGIRTSEVDFERGLIKIWDEKKDLWRFIMPTNEALSAVTPDHPVFLVGLHGFAGWANAKALEIGKDVCVTAAQKEKWPPGDYWRPGERLPGR